MSEIKRKRRFGDRKDGRRLRTLEPMSVVMPFFMKERNDAVNYIQDTVELSDIEKLVRIKKAEGKLNFNAMHVLFAAYVRSISQKPGCNRFISGQRIYARNDIVVIMEVKKQLQLNAPATMLKFHFKPTDTVDDIYEEMNSKIEAFKNEDDTDSNFEKIVHLIGYVPRFLLKLFVSVLKFLDYFGWLPNFLTELSPFHGSLVVTSMASLGIPAIFHHLYNFGNIPMFISFSTARHENELDKDGNLLRRHYLDINYSTDDRICDGQYYAAALREIRKYLKNPDLLLNPPETVIEDIE